MGAKKTRRVRVVLFPDRTPTRRMKANEAYQYKGGVVRCPSRGRVLQEKVYSRAKIQKKRYYEDLKHHHPPERNARETSETISFASKRAVQPNKSVMKIIAQKNTAGAPRTPNDSKRTEKEIS